MLFLTLILVQFSRVIFQVTADRTKSISTLDPAYTINTWIIVEEKRFFVSQYHVENYAKALNICELNGGYLAVIKTDNVRNALLQEINNQKFNDTNLYYNFSLYIGFQLNNLNQFQWSDGSNASSGKTYWGQNQPQSARQGQSFVVMGTPLENNSVQTFDLEFLWRTVGINYSGRFICEQSNETDLFGNIPTRIPPNEIGLFNLAPIIGGSLVGSIIVIGLVTTAFTRLFRRRSNIALTESMFRHPSDDANWISRLASWLSRNKSEANVTAAPTGNQATSSA